MQLNSQRRNWLADKLGDLAILTIAALLISQFVSKDFDITQSIIGFSVAVVTFIASFIILK